MLDRLLKVALASIVRVGSLRVTTATGRTFTLGDGSGKPLALRITTRAAQLGIMLDPELKFGEAYMDGTVIVEQGSI
ncbi:MAG TPA: SAM-dependent methyltransferase, partial [Xanthobacteraceae bacterium]|nr:SAM-dependent methyltransferase [Xanthobacteraceae bacterium]